MKITTVEGPTLEKAFNNQANYSIDIDATLAWKKSGDQDISEFALEYLRKKTALTEGLGAFIVLETPKTKIPTKETKVENIITSVRKWKTIYEFVDARTELVIKTDLPIPLTKGEAVKQAKEIAISIKTDIIVQVNKVLIQGNQQAAIVKIQQPEIKLGKFVFFGVEELIEENEESSTN